MNFNIKEQRPSQEANRY